MTMVGIQGGRTDAKTGSVGRVWLIRARGSDLYRLSSGSWGAKTSDLRVANATEREAQAWWDFHGDATLVWMEQV